MKILLAPSESKIEGGGGSFLLHHSSFRFSELFPFQKEIVNLYEEHILNLDDYELSNWFGLKSIEEVKKYKQSLQNLPTMKAIQRYNGVAFDAINYDSLQKNEQKYCNERVLIFSNLFGVLCADDKIPNYKYKQGSKLPNIDVESYYNKNISKFLDEFLGDEIIDLRAGFYEKFYKPKKANVLSFKFIKDGKVVSHWAKFYRGKLLHYLAKNSIQNFDEFMKLEFEDLKLIEIQQKKNIKLLVMDIVK